MWLKAYWLWYEVDVDSAPGNEDGKIQTYCLTLALGYSFDLGSSGFLLFQCMMSRIGWSSSTGLFCCSAHHL